MICHAGVLCSHIHQLQAAYYIRRRSRQPESSLPSGCSRINGSSADVLAEAGLPVIGNTIPFPAVMPEVAIFSGTAATGMAASGIGISLGLDPGLIVTAGPQIHAGIRREVQAAHGIGEHLPPVALRV